MDSLLLELGVVVSIALVLGFAAKLAKLPPILGYIMAGFSVSLLFPEIHTNHTLEFFGELGVAFLLFMLGLELNITELREVGRAALFTGIGQVVATYLVALGIAHYLFGYGFLEGSYVAIALAFSSTIIVIKLLGEKGDLYSLYGRIAVGFLIVQDLIAILSLILLNSASAFTSGTVSIGGELLKIGLTGVLLVPLAFVLGRIMLLLINALGKSTELILLAAIAWALVFALICQKLGFSVEVGAFLAGMALGTSRQSLEIAAKIKPLRDFFIIIFFITLGTGLSLGGIVNNVVPILLFSVFVLISSPLIMLGIMGAMGYHRRVSFLTGLAVAQVSEFSLILLSTGVVLGQVRQDTLSIVTGVAILTLVCSSYLINRGEWLYDRLSEPLRMFQRRNLRRHHQPVKTSQEQVLIFGAHRMGEEILKVFSEQGVKALVVDYDPLVIRELDERGVRVVYGDVSDPELLDQLQLDGISAVISTVPSLEDNLFLLSQLQQKENVRTIIIRAQTEEQGQVLRSHGATHALVPEVLAGERVAWLIIKHGIVETVSKEK